MIRTIRQLINWCGRHIAPITVAFGGVVVSFLLINYFTLGPWELRIEQLRQTQFAPSNDRGRVIVITIDEQDAMALDHLVSDGRINHRHYGNLIRLLKAAGTRCVLFDFTMARALNRADDQSMIREIERAAPMNLTFLTADSNPVSDPSEPLLGTRYHFEWPFYAPKPLARNIEVGQGLLLDTGEFASAIPLLVKDESSGTQIQHIALCMFRQTLGIGRGEVQYLPETDSIAFGQTAIQVGASMDMTIEWNRAGSKIRQMSLSEALTILKGSDSSIFRDHAVLVGIANDLPLETANGQMRGTLIVAHALNTLLKPERLKSLRLDISVNYAWAFLLSLLVTVGLSSPALHWRYSGPMLAIVAVIVTPIPLLVQGQRVLETVLPSLAVATALIGGLAVRSLRPNWFPLPNRIPVVGTVMFLDVEDSTGLVASLGPSKSRVLLTDLLAKAAKIVAHHQGDVIRDDGDGLLCFFPQSSDREHATDSIACVAPLRALARKLGNTHGLDLRFTIGIESGPVSRDAQVIHGVTVHKAARLQSMCRGLGVDLIIGPAAKALSEHRWSFVKAGDVSLKGFEGTTECFILTPLPSAVPVRD
jgi:class 3 adenylate cyclase